MKKTLKYIFYISIAAHLVLLIFRDALPKESKIDQRLQIEPIQELIQKESFTLKKDGSTINIEPLAGYQISGLIVEDYDPSNILDYTHKNDPFNTRDICLIWGDNLNQTVFDSVEFSHGEFTCYYRWPNREVRDAFSQDKLSNTHIIPANDSVAKKISKTRIGDQISMIGYLANYSIDLENGKYQRKTSLRRDDRGNGACEVLYLENFEVIKKRKHTSGNIINHNKTCRHHNPSGSNNFIYKRSSKKKISL